MMIGIYLRMSRGAVCVTHKSLNHKKHTISAQTGLKLSAKAFSLVDCHAQKRANKSPPFQTLVTIPTTAFTHFCWWRVWSSAIRSPWQNMRREKKRTGNMRIKARRWKEEEVVFAQCFFFEEQVKQKRRETAWCNGCPTAEINDNWMHMDLTRSTTSRHAAMVKRAFNRARDPQRMWILKKFWKNQMIFFWTEPPLLFFLFKVFPSLKKFQKKVQKPIYSRMRFFKGDFLGWKNSKKDKNTRKTEQKKQKKRKKTQQAQKNF